MKRHILKKMLCMLLVSFALAVPVKAAEVESPTVELMYTGIESFYTNLLINNSGVATSHVRATATESTQTVKLVVYLERSSDGVSWSKIVKVWTTEGQGSATISETCSVTSGYYYRLKCYATVYDADGSYVGLNTKYSSSVYCSN